MANSSWAVRPIARRGGALLLLALVALLVPRTAFAHPGAAPEPHDLWRAWTFAPLVVLPLVAGAVCYQAGVRALWRHAGGARGISAARVASFAAGMLALVVALVSPVDAVAESLFAVHMVQHLLLVVVAAPLLVLGRPQAALLWALPIGGRRAVGGWWHRRSLLRAAWRTLQRPGVAWTVHVVTLWLWHLPGPYDAALRSPATHALEHAGFLLTALLFWWVVLGDRPAAHRPRLPVLYLFAAATQCTILGAILTMSRQVLYWGHYSTTRAWGFTPMEDQQLAGLIMWMPGGAVYLAALVPFVLAALRDPASAHQRDAVRGEQPVDLRLPALDHRIQ